MALDALSEAVAELLASRTNELFQVTFQAHAGLLTPKPDPGHPGITGDISAIVAINEAHFMGRLLVVFPKETIFSLLERTHDQRFDNINKPVCDAVGEIANVLTGMIKKNLSDQGYRFKMSLPQVSSPLPRPVWAPKCSGDTLNFQSDCGPFSVSFELCPTPI